MTKRVMAGVCLGVWLGCFSFAAAQLSAECKAQVKVDLRQQQAERLMKEGDTKKALKMLKKIRAILREHNHVTWPTGFHVRFVEATLTQTPIPKNEVSVVIDVVKTYISKCKRETKDYQQALELLDKAKQAQGWIVENKSNACANSGESCWVQLSDKQGCFIWTPNFEPSLKVTWTGGCFGGRAKGYGTLKLVRYGSNASCESTGRFKGGKKHGTWVERRPRMRITEEGTYKEGKRDGHWVVRGPKGKILKKGNYVNGKQDGQWEFRCWVTYENGSYVNKSMPSEIKECPIHLGGLRPTGCR